MVDSLRKESGEGGALGERLKQFRESLNLDQKAFAKRVGAGARTYQEYEAGRSSPKVAVLLKLAEMGCDLTWLLTSKRVDQSNQSVLPHDPLLSARVVEMITRVYREVGARLTDSDLRRLAREKYEEIQRIADDPEDYGAQTEIVGNKLRRLLREAKPGSGKRSA